MPPPDPRTPRDAPDVDGRVAHLTIVDPLHPLYGHHLAVVCRRSGRGPDVVVVRLADGRERSVRRSATDLAGSWSDSLAKMSSRSPISVRTLLPLANHLRIMLASEHDKLSGDPLPSQRPAPSMRNGPDPAGTGGATSVVRAPCRGPTTAGATDSAASPAPAITGGSVRGGKSC